MALLTPPRSRSLSLEADRNVASSCSTQQEHLSSSGLDGFHQLVADLSEMLEGSSGRTIADVDPTRIIQRIEQYSSSQAEWSRYAFADLSRGYTRNLVDAGKGKSNLLVLVWTPGKGSPIHDHADAHCVMKVLKGRLKESRFAWPADSCTGPLKLTGEKILNREEVAYMSDTLGLHRISNPDPEQIAVSLHLYTPPNAAIHGCDIFDEKTGRRTHVQQCNFFSEYGMLN